MDTARMSDMENVLLLRCHPWSFDDLTSLIRVHRSQTFGGLPNGNSADGLLDQHVRLYEASPTE